MASKQFGNITINTSHYDDVAKSYRYKFPQSVAFRNAKVSVQSLAVYNSTYNITADRQNNKCTIKWLGTDYNLTLPDSFLDFNGFNYFLKQQCLLNKLYCITTSGDFVYFINVSTNAATYKAQFDFYTIPTSAQATTLGYTIPPGATWAFPGTQTTPQLLIANNLRSYFGFKTQTLFPLTPQNTNQTILSDPNAYPTVNPVFAYLLSCNLINTKFSLEPGLLTQITVNTDFGGLMQMQGSHDSAIDVEDGSYSEITIKLLDQTLLPLQHVDKDLVLTLKLEF